MKMEEYLRKLILFLGVEEEEIDLKVKKDDTKVDVKIYVPEEKASLFIGNRGQTLYSIQHIVRLVFREDYEGMRLILDVNDYRAKKEKDILNKAFEAAEKVLNSGEDQVLRGLNSYERYLIHTAISQKQDFEDLTTESYDEGQERCLIIREK